MRIRELVNKVLSTSSIICSDWAFRINIEFGLNKIKTHRNKAIYIRLQILVDTDFLMMQRKIIKTNTSKR